MRLKSYISSVVFIVALASCKSVKKVTNSDNTGSTTVAKKSVKNKREFIDNIEVAPGSVTTTKHKSTSTATTTKKATKPVITNNKANIEKASWLQLKYAVLMDAPAEELSNIPLLELIEKWWGTKYCIGGSSSNCIDCSAFTQVVMREIFNTTLPRTAQEQFNGMQRIEMEDLQEGDLVFFNTGGRGISHVGVYLQNNKFVHASTSQGVTITDLSDKYWRPKFRGGGRGR